MMRTVARRARLTGLSLKMSCESQQGGGVNKWRSVPIPNLYQPVFFNTTITRVNIALGTTLRE